MVSLSFRSIVAEDCPAHPTRDQQIIRNSKIGVLIELVQSHRRCI